jgi:tripartite-type tricarboxylate transporter receptor subunit TctC
MRSLAVRAFHVVCLLLCAALPGQGYAQNFPDRPITLICPWPAGGGTDVAMRALAEAMSKPLGQRVVIENRPGAAGTIGPGNMAQNAKPDGYTLSQIPIGVFRIPYIQKVNYDPVNDFTWIIGITGYTFGVVVRSDSPWRAWKEFIAYAKANPGKVTYSTPGTGTSLHITMEEIGQREGIEWVHVPFKGNADATAALMGGHVSASADSTGWGEHVDSGRLRMLVTWGEERTKRWPTVPTLKELGYGIVSNSPYGIAGPRGMDPKVVRILHDAIRKAIEDPAYLRTIERLDQEPWYRSSEDYAKYVRDYYPTQKVVMERLGLKP